MGACLSCGSSSKFNNIRVVHLNGYVEDFEQPISASQIIGNPPKHFVCTSIQLLSSSSSKSLKGDTQLQPGQVYFMLPYSILQDDFSPVDLASIAKRLTAIAKTRPSCEYNNSSSSNSNDNSTKSNIKASPVSSQTFWISSSPSSSSPSREEQIGLMNGGFGTCRVQPWKPMLDTIREKSFTRRTESDLQENGSLMSFTKRTESDLHENGSLMSSFTKRSESDLHENVDLCLQDLGSRQPEWKKTCKMVY